MRILTYNILNGGITRESLILKTIKLADPDIVILQEVFDSTPIEKFASQLHMAHFLARGNSRRHLAILSRFPIVNAHSYHPFPPSVKSTLYAKIEPSPGHFVHAFGIHLVPHPFIALELWRKWEKDVALHQALSFDSEPTFLAGDFNAIAPGDRPNIEAWPKLLKLMIVLQGGRLFHFAIRDILLKGFVDCYRKINPQKHGFTLPAGSPTTRLDYIFANQTLQKQLKSCRVFDEPPEAKTASDHYPLLAIFDI